MSFKFSRLKNWLGYGNLTSADINAEFNNILNSAGADTLSSANSTSGSAPTVAAMQATENPGGVGSEVLSTTVQEDEKQLRYQLNQIIGGAQWYSAPVQSLSGLNTLITGSTYIPTNRIVSGRVATNQPMFLVPSGSTATVTLKATATNLSTYIGGTAYSLVADASISSLTTAAAANNTCLVNDTSLTGQQSSKAQGERGTFINIDNIGSAITALNGTYAAFKHSTEYFIAEVDTSNNRLKNAWRGVGFNSSDAWQARTAMSDDDTITLMKLAWIFGLSTGALDVTYNRPTVSYVAPSSPAIGDYWQDLSVSLWKKWNGTTWVSQGILLGLCIMDTTACQVARSFDFYKPYSTLNSLEIEYVDSTDVRANRLGGKVSVYGTVWSYDYDFVTWNTTSQLDSGVSLANSTTYWLYITDKGDRFISDVQPYARTRDLLGHYHPAKPWRCVGEFQTDGSSNVTSSTVVYWRYYQTLLSAPPTVQKFTTAGSGTYLTPQGPLPLYLRVRMVGAGGGGAGGGGNNSAGNGGNSTFGSSLLTANGGTGAATSGAVPAGGAGGSASLGTGPIGFAISGASGNNGSTTNTTSYSGPNAATGGSSILGGAGIGAIAGTSGGANAAANSGSGGGGGSTATNLHTCGGGGGAGGFVDAIIFSPALSYSYTVGAKGAGGTGSDSNGGAGGDGFIIVEEFYQ